MKRIRTAFIALALAALAGCGAVAHHHHGPPHSAAKACKDFTVWFTVFNHNLTQGAHSGILAQAVADAPSGALYRDLSTFRSNVLTAASTPGSLGQAEANYAMTSAFAVANDCQAVNPAS